MSVEIGRAVPEWQRAACCALGGGVGSVLRYMLGIWLRGFTGWPQILAVMGINLVGGVVAGYLAMRWSRVGSRVGSRAGARPGSGARSGDPSRAMHESRRWAFFLPGVCGGFTTFAAFGLLAEDALRQQWWGMAIGGLFVGLVVGLFAGRVGSALVSPTHATGS